MFSFLLIPILIASGSCAVIKGTGSPALRIIGIAMLLTGAILVAQVAGGINDIAANVLR